MTTKPDKKKKLNVKLESFDLTITDVFGIILRTLKLLVNFIAIVIFLIGLFGAGVGFGYIASLFDNVQVPESAALVSQVTELSRISKVVYSDYIEIVQGTTPEISVVSALNGTPTMTENVSLLSCVGIEFYQKVGTDYFVFSVGNSMKIKNVF